MHFTASPWAYDGKVFCLNEDGVTFVLRAGDKFELLHTNKLADDDMCMATPAIVGRPAADPHVAAGLLRPPVRHCPPLADPSNLQARPLCSAIIAANF